MEWNILALGTLCKSMDVKFNMDGEERSNCFIHMKASQHCSLISNCDLNFIERKVLYLPISMQYLTSVCIMV